MKRLVVLVLMLAACKDEAAQSVSPVALSAAALGHYCQMNILEHPGPKAQVHLAGMPGAPLFFSQVRDAIAYARLPEQTHPILAIYVNDMGAAGATWDMPGATNWIAADRALFVVGSSREGGMGAPELVPFASPGAAQAFADAQGGRVVPLAGISDADVIAPVAPQSGGATDDAADYAERLRQLSHKPGG